MLGRQTTRNRKAAGGFTLIELMVVIAVIAILLTLGVAVGSKLMQNAEEAAAQQLVTQVQGVAKELQTLRNGRPLDHNDLGKGTSGLVKEAKKHPTTERLLNTIPKENRQGDKIIDPWKEELIYVAYVFHGKNPGWDDILPEFKDPFVASSGPDQEFGNAKQDPDDPALRDNIYSYDY